MKVIKRNRSEQTFDKQKIANAVLECLADFNWPGAPAFADSISTEATEQAKRRIFC